MVHLKNSDAQERLSYCAEMRLRQDVQMFEPLPSQLAYPDILEKFIEFQLLQQPKLQQNEDELQLVVRYFLFLKY